MAQITFDRISLHTCIPLDDENGGTDNEAKKCRNIEHFKASTVTQHRSTVDNQLSFVALPKKSLKHCQILF